MCISGGGFCFVCLLFNIAESLLACPQGGLESAAVPGCPTGRREVIHDGLGFPGQRHVPVGLVDPACSCVCRSQLGSCLSLGLNCLGHSFLLSLSVCFILAVA